MKLKLFTFDIFDTIIYVRGSASHFYAKIGREFGVNAPEDELKAAYPKVWSHIKTVHPTYGVHQGMTAREWWAKFTSLLFAHVGHPLKATQLQQISHTLYGDFCKKNNWGVFDNAEGILTQMKDNGMKLGVISNFDERLPWILEELDLLKYFDFMVTSHMTKCEKPDPTMFRLALTEVGVEPHEAGHIGDDLIADYWGAQKAGLHPFLLDKKGKYTDSDLCNVKRSSILKDLSDLAPLLRDQCTACG